MACVCVLVPFRGDGVGLLLDCFLLACLLMTGTLVHKIRCPCVVMFLCR